MQKIIFYFCLVFLTFNCLFVNGQITNLDSLNNALDEATQDTTIANTLVNLAEYYGNSKNDSCDYYCKKAESFIQEKLRKNSIYKDSLSHLLARIYFLQGSRSLREGRELSTPLNFYQKAYDIYEVLNDDVGRSNLLSSINYIHKRQGNNEETDNIIMQVKKLAKSTTDSLAKSINYITISTHFNYIEKLDSSIFYMEKSLDVAERLNDHKTVAFCVGTLSTLFIKKDNYDKALEFAFRGLKVCENANYKKGSMFILINIGSIYLKMKKFQRSLSILKSAQEISNQQTNIQAELMIAENFSIAYNELDQIDSTLKYSNKVLNIIKEKHFGERFESNNYNRLSIIYKKQNDFDKAFYYAKKSLETHLVPDRINKASKLYNLGDLYFIKGDLDSSKIFALESLDYFREEEDQEGIMKSTNLLSKIFYTEKDFEKAFEYLKTSEAIEDNLYTEETEKRLAKNDVKFNLHKKEFEIENKKNQISILQKNKRIKNYTLLVLVLLFIIGIFAFLLFFQRQKGIEEESRNQIFNQIKEIEKLNKKLDILKGNTLEEELSFIDLNKILETPLSERELEVLTELSNGLTNKEISEKLFVSINTVKTHIKKIYIKLDVNNRIQALNKVNDLYKV